MAVSLSHAQQALFDQDAKHRLKVGKYVRLVNPSSLTDHQRQLIWRGIKTKNPALADMLKNDPNIAALKAAFDAQVVFTVEETNGYMDGGK